MIEQQSLGLGSFTVLKRAGYLSAMCNKCKEKTSVPDKGLGRATLATWKTRHQHEDG